MFADDIYGRMRKTATIVLGAALVLASTSCGSDKKLATPATTTKAASVTTVVTVPTANGAATTDPSADDTSATVDDTIAVDDTIVTDESTVIDPSDAPGFGSDFCNAIDTASQASDDLAGIFAGTGTVEENAAAFDDFTAALATLIAVSPDQLLDDLAILQGSFEDYRALLASNGYDLTTLTEDSIAAAQLDELDSQESNDAGDRVDAYSDAECGATVGG